MKVKVYNVQECIRRISKIRYAQNPVWLGTNTSWLVKWPVIDEHIIKYKVQGTKYGKVRNFVKYVLLTDVRTVEPLYKAHSE